MRRHEPLVSMVILAGPDIWQRKKEFLRTLRSISRLGYSRVEVVVINNGGDPSLEAWVKVKFPEFKYWRLPMNRGVSGYSFGFKKAKGEYIFVLDDDCTASENAVDRAVAIFTKDKEKKIGALSLNVYKPSSNVYPYKHYESLRRQELVTFAGGACVFRREVFRKAGYYDEDFFCWVHEDDLAMRMLKKGFRIAFAKDIVVRHDDESKKRKIRTSKLFLISRNRAWFNLKHFPFWMFPLLMVKDFYFVILKLLKNNPIWTLVYSLAGYFWGYLAGVVPLRQRRVINWTIQKLYIENYLYLAGYYLGRKR